VSRFARLHRSHRPPLGPVALTAAVAATLWLVPDLALAANEALAAAPEAHGDGGIEWVTPIIGNTGKLGLLWSFINFAVLLWILEKILFKPLRSRTRDKHDAVKSELDKATAARQEAEGVLAEYRGRIERLDAEVAELLAEAKAKAEADRIRIIDAAKREAEQITATAMATAEREAAARRRQLEAEIVERAVERAEALLRSKITPADQRGMVDRYVEQLGSVDFGGRST
jgi:F-type H+-transporting ATPase subunit b